MRLFPCIIGCLLSLAIALPSAQGFDPKPGLYKGTVKVTTAFPNTDVKQAVSQRATGRLDANGRMIIALSNTFNGIEEPGQQVAFLKFTSPTTNEALVRILKDNYISANAFTTVQGKTFTLVRTQQLNGQDAEGFNTAYTVTLQLRMTRVAP
jgi:hypothetical protein